MALCWMACNRREYSCGCVSWLQWESGAWVEKNCHPYCLCSRHLTTET